MTEFRKKSALRNTRLQNPTASGPLPLARGGLGWGSSGFNYTSGPLPLARGGLGWGSSAVAIATSLTLNNLSACMEAGKTSLLRARAIARELTTHSFILTGDRLSR
ncbi:hypothetical protein NG791_18185 [Laspinema sp. D1]|uniref:hypothetical protein n=1 Tax=Laspinema palackyanum TaxID=3231601 RepID=UPI003498DE07|nr:hypothetical protein [Laspinema sp. D2b]